MCESFWYKHKYIPQIFLIFSNTKQLPGSSPWTKSRLHYFLFKYRMIFALVDNSTLVAIMSLWNKNKMLTKKLNMICKTNLESPVLLKWVKVKKMDVNRYW